ncbi:MAG: NAD-dependent deacylase [Elusimicrobiota bacterium]
MDKEFARLRPYLDGSRRVRVLTGAGVSAESGIPTFRGKGGLWNDHRPEDLATARAFHEDPELVWRWYDWRRGLIAKAAPNAAHKALAAMEARIPDFWLITQNVDGLHRRSGSRRVLALHGDIFRALCLGCGRYSEEEKTPLEEVPPHCRTCGALLRPDVVWFGEPLPQGTFVKALRAARDAELFLVVGTSGAVEPAASLAREAKKAGALLAEVNPEASELSAWMDLSVRESAAKALSVLIDTGPGIR